jgi:hypothetical protein
MIAEEKMKSLLGLLLTSLAVVHLFVGAASGDVVVVSETFTGRLAAYTTPGAGSTQFAQLQLRGDSLFPLLSGLHYHGASNRLYATELDRGGTSNGRVHVLNATTGAILGTQDFNFGVTGMAVGSTGDIFLSDFGSNLVRRYNSSFVHQGDIEFTGAGPTSGLVFDGNDLYVSTFGTGIFRYDGNSVSLFSAQGGASAQLAFDADGNLYAGHGLGFSDFAHRFDTNGNEFLNGGAPFLEVTDAMVNSSGSGSSFGNSPSGLAFDANGNLLVAALGKSNPFDAGGERGGLFLFNRDGQLLDTFASGSRAYSGVAFITAVPEPGSLVVLLVCGGIAAAVRRRR